MDTSNEDDTSVVLETTAERWRLVCPAGHRGRNVVRRDGYWSCVSCEETGTAPEYQFDTVLDEKTGRRLSPSDVTIRGSARVDVGTVRANDD